MTLKHYATVRTSGRLLPFWSNRGLSEQAEENQGELLVRAVQFVERAAMVAHGALTLGDPEK